MLSIHELHVDREVPKGRAELASVGIHAPSNDRALRPAVYRWDEDCQVSPGYTLLFRGWAGKGAGCMASAVETSTISMKVANGKV